MDSQLRVYVGADTAMFKKQIKSAQGTLNHFTKVSVDAGNTIRKAFVNAFAITSAYDFFNNLIKVGSGFEDQMAKVKAVTNATTTQLKMMEQEAARLGATTAYTASQAAKALENLTRNGLSARKATKSLSSVLELAGANAIELAEAADIVTNTMNMFQLQVEDLNKVNDVLSATCANSATNITDLYEAMKYAGSTANLFGISLEETSAALGVLANMGIKGSDAGTALRSMLLRLAAPTTKAADVLREYGLEIDQTTIKMDGLEKTIKKLYDSGIGNDVAALQVLFGKQFGGTNAALINSYGSLVNMNQITAGSQGTAARMFKQGMGEFKAATDTFSSNLESAMIQLFNNIKPIGIWLLNTMNDIVSMAKSTGWWLMNGAIIGLGKSTQYVTKMSKEASIIQEYSNQAFKAKQNVEKIKPFGGWNMNDSDIGALRTLKDIYQELSQEALKAGVTLTDVNDAVLKARAAISAGSKKNQQLFDDSIYELEGIFEQIEIAANRTNGTSNKVLNNIGNGLKSLGKNIVNFFGGWWNIAIGGVIVAANSIYNAWQKSTKAMKEHKAIQNEVATNNARLDISFKNSINSLRNLTKESGAWRATVDYLKREYPELIDKIDLEAIHVNTSAEAWAKYTKELNNAVEAQKKYNKAEAAQKSIDTLSDDVFNKVFSTFFINKSYGASETDKITKFDPAKEAIRELIKQGNVTPESLNKVFSDYKISVDKMDKLINNLVANTKKQAGYQEIPNLVKLINEKTDAPKLDSKALNEDLAKYMARFEQNKAALEEEGKLAGKDQETINSEIQSLAEKFVNEIINKYKGVQIDGKKATDLLAANANFQNIRMASVVTDTGGEDKKVDPQKLLTWNIEGWAQQEAKGMNNALRKAIESGDKIPIKNIPIEIDEEVFEAAIPEYKDYEKGSLRDLQDRISVIRYKIESTSDDATIDKLKEELDKLTKEEQKIIVKIDGVDGMPEAFGNIADMFGEAQRAAEKFGDEGLAKAMQSLSSTALFAQAIAALVKTLMTCVTPWDYIAAISAGVASTIAAFASFPAFATGGIVGGNSTVGDHNLVRVNSGEMILNGRQQKNLFNLLNGNGGIASGNGQVEFKIKGTELVGVLNNYSNKKGKVR